MSELSPPASVSLQPPEVSEKPKAIDSRIGGSNEKIKHLLGSGQTVVKSEAVAEPNIAQAFRDSRKNPDNILYHVTLKYDPKQGGLDPTKGKGDGSGRVWFRDYGPHSSGGNQVLAIDKTQLEPSHLSQDNRGYWSYDKQVPPSAILDLGRRPEMDESIHDLIAKKVEDLQAQV